MDLKRYAQLKNELAEIQNELALIEKELAQHVKESGEVAGFGYRAYMKAGRKVYQHEKAAKDNNAPEELIKKYTTIPDPSIQWAKVTKEMKLNLSAYTTTGSPVFVVEAIKAD